MHLPVTANDVTHGYKWQVLTLASYFCPEEGQSIWSKRRQGSNPVLKLVLENYLFLMTKPDEKPSLQTLLVVLGPIRCHGNDVYLGMFPIQNDNSYLMY